MADCTVLKGKRLMPPLWLAYPRIERYSIGWRMGYGEAYRMKFAAWLHTLSQEEREEYESLFPEPVTWKGWWQDKDGGEELTQGEFFVELWQPQGMPKYSVPKLEQEAAGGGQRDFCLFWKPQPSKDGSMTESCLSQWWMSDFRSVVTDYCCMEQFMMAEKAQLFGDKEVRQQILECRDPGKIKALGRKVRGFDQALWDKAKYSIVLNGNWHKFSQDKALREFLLSTGESILAEASPYDGIWGIRLSANAPGAQRPAQWKGQNLLGFALMEVRDELRRVTENEALCDFGTVDE